MTTMDKLRRARTLLILDHPFFGALALRLELQEDRTVETACTDGKRIGYNPDWIDGLAEPELLGVLAHEVLHVAAGHAWRRDEREPCRWNMAADYAINGVLIEAGLQLPRGALLDQTYRDKAAEEVYALLPPPPREGGEKDAPGQSGDDGQGRGAQGKATTADPGGCGGVMDAPEGEDEAGEREWKVATAQAAQVARGMGNLPGSLDRLVQGLLDPVVPWYTLLRDFVERAARNDYDWRRPNPRYMGMGVVLPGLVSEELPEVVVVVDTSGSIGQEDLDRFAAEASGVLGCYETTIHLVYADAEVRGTEELTRADLPMTFHPKGGGGTDFRPAFDWVTKQGFTPACLIYLTDLFGTFPSKEPDYPVLWVSTTKGREAPFGVTVLIE